MQARKLRESLSKISDGLQQWASKTLLVAGAYKQLADLITDTPTQLTDSKVFPGMCSGQIQSKLHFVSQPLPGGLSLIIRLCPKEVPF